jgi:hypothetical protein
MGAPGGEGEEEDRRGRGRILPELYGGTTGGGLRRLVSEIKKEVGFRMSCELLDD